MTTTPHEPTTMTPDSRAPQQPDPALDLVLEREVDITPEQCFAGWTQPELMTEWFCPRPWKTTEAEVDLRPGGIFRTVMRGPDGPEVSGTGCILEVLPGRKFVWTGALGPGFRPKSREETANEPFLFTGILTFEPTPSGGTRYRALAVHSDEAGRKRHEEMGFHAGWGAALDQLVELMKGR